MIVSGWLLRHTKEEVTKHLPLMGRVVFWYAMIDCIAMISISSFLICNSWSYRTLTEVSNTEMLLRTGSSSLSMTRAWILTGRAGILVSFSGLAWVGLLFSASKKSVKPIPSQVTTMDIADKYARTSLFLQKAIMQAAKSQVDLSVSET